MIYYPAILWFVFLGILFLFVGFNFLIKKQKSSIYKLFYKKNNIYDFASKVGPIITPYIPVGKQMDLSSKLAYADYPLGLRTESFVGLQIVLALIAIVVGLVLTSFGMPSFIILILAFVAYFTPSALLNERVEKRQNIVKRDLPSMVGLLATSVKAGIELGPALEMISMNIPDVLGDELRKAMKEIATGSQRSKTLKRMCERIGVDSLDRFIETINTAEERGGMNISNVLEDFTEDIRIMKQLNMEEKARKLPTKMLLPIFTCVFIPMLVLLLTPVVFILLETI